MKFISKMNTLILLFFFVASIFILINQVLWQNLYVFSNSDFLYIPSLIKDYAEGIYSWKQWTLPPAPSFFPDLLFYFLISLLGKNLVISSIIYGVVFGLLLIFSTSLIFHSTEKKFSFGGMVKAITFGYTLLFLIFSLYPEDIGLFLIPSYHGSVYIYSITFYALSFKKYNKRNIYLFFLLSIIAIISDKQILYGFFFPFLITSFLLRKETGENFFLRTLFYLLFGLVASVLILKVLSFFEIFKIPGIPIWIELKKNIFQLKVITNIIEVFPEVKAFFINFYKEKSLLFFLFLSSIGLNMYYSLAVSKAKYEVRFLSQFILWVYFFSIGSQIFFGVWGGFRYMWAIFIFPLFVIFYYTRIFVSKIRITRNDSGIGLNYHYLKKLSQNRIRLKFLPLVLLLLSELSLLAFFSNKTRVISLEVPYPPFISCLDTVKDKYKLANGISDYWNAKHIRYLSHKHLIVNQTFTNLERYDWVHNREWYEKEKMGNPIRYNFIIPERLDENIIVTKYGIPNLIEKCEGREIFIYSQGFTY